MQKRTQTQQQPPTPATVLNAMADRLDATRDEPNDEINLVNTHAAVLQDIAPGVPGIAKPSWDAIPSDRPLTRGEQADLLRETAKGLQ